MKARPIINKLRRARVAAGKAARCAKAAHRALHVAEFAILVAESEHVPMATLKKYCGKAQDAATALDQYSTFLGEAAASVVGDRRSESKLKRRARARTRRIGRRKG